MTGHKGNSEFCLPETLINFRGEVVGNIEVEGKQKSLFPAGPVIKCFVLPPNSKLEKTAKENVCFMSAASNFSAVPRSMITCECSRCRFPRELVSFVRTREILRFDPPHVTRFSPIEKRI